MITPRAEREVYLHVLISEENKEYLRELQESLNYSNMGELVNDLLTRLREGDIIEIDEK